MTDNDSDVHAEARAKYGKVEPEGPDPFANGEWEPEAKQTQEEKVYAERLAKYQSALCTFAEFCELDVKPRERLIGKWMREGDTGFIFGQRGTGKTWLVDLIISHVSSGRDIDEEWDVPTQQSVLLVDGEMPWDDTRSRLLGLGADKNFLRILHHEVLFDRTGLTMNLTNPKVQQIITQLCEDAKARLLVLDTQSSLFRGMAEKDSDAWELVIDWLLSLRRRRITTLIVLHSGWTDDHARGTSRREDDAFWVVQVKQSLDQNPGEPGCKFETNFTKWRNLDAKPNTRIWHVVTEPDGSVTYNCDELSFDEKVLNLIRDGLATASVIAEELGCNRSTVTRAADRLEEKKLIERRGSGTHITYEPRGWCRK
jgi:putative DNA primase/helicase